MSRVFLIGNGFDLSHNLPTHFERNFKPIAEFMEQTSYFWEIYQSREINIWSDFENYLAHPNFNNLEEIFNGYQPDYLSDHESDRDEIITQVDLNGNLASVLYEFAEQAEAALESSVAQMAYIEMFKPNDLFINFNYTHTLERLYEINRDQVLHIHGEIGANNLIMGYPDGTFEPEKYVCDVRQKGRGPYTEVDIQKHIEDMLINDMMDIYTYQAYRKLLDKTQSYAKKPQLPSLKHFLGSTDISEICVLWHSCAIDFPYFAYLNNRFTKTNWRFYAYDDKTRNNIERLVNNTGIINYRII